MASPTSAPQTVTGELKKLQLVVTTRDIIFNCPNCRGELVVDRDGAGLEVPCSHCGQPLIVPPYDPPAATAPTPTSTLTLAAAPVTAVARSEPITVPPVPVRTFDHSDASPEQLARRLDELKHQLKENRSQDTEMRGHVNRATMELHRLQLRLKKLQERQVDIEAEVASIQSHLGTGVP